MNEKQYKNLLSIAEARVNIMWTNKRLEGMI